VKEREAAEAVRQSRNIGRAGRASTSAARDMPTATGSNRVVLRPRPNGMAEGGGNKEGMADVDKDEKSAGEARYVTMAKTKSPTRTAIATKTDTGTGALPTNETSDGARQRKLIRMDHSGAGDGNRTQGGRSVLARATERKWRYWDLPLGIRNENKQMSVDSESKGGWPGA